MTIEMMKKAVCRAVDRRRKEIIAIGDRIWREPELGFKEFKTAALVKQTLAGLKIPYKDGLAVTGVRATLKGGRADGPVVAIIGEMDSVVLPEHPAADPKTGAVHACGHNAQIAGLLGAVMGLTGSGVMEHLRGKVAVLAVPAEEYLDIEYRRGLVNKGIIGLLGGKAELIRAGCFDDVDMAIMFHAGEASGVVSRTSMNGFVCKRISFRGRAAHAGLRPYQGINALNMAHLAMAGIHAQRETFRDEDAVRVHFIITRGGSALNIVPKEVCLEVQIRARTVEAITDAARKVDRAVKSGAMAMGGSVTIDSLPGYLPLVDHSGLAGMFINNAAAGGIAGEPKRYGHLGSSTDMGDVSQIMPASHPGTGGAEGAPHTTQFRITDPDLAYVAPARILAMSVIDLLAHGAANARKILKGYTPCMTKKEYLDFMKRMFRKETVNYGKRPA